MLENSIPGHKLVDKSVGLLMSGLQARIIREDGTDGGIGEPGELWVEGDCIPQCAVFINCHPCCGMWILQYNMGIGMSLARRETGPL
jgi:hypothetical protein